MTIARPQTTPSEADVAKAIYAVQCVLSRDTVFNRDALEILRRLSEHRDQLAEQVKAGGMKLKKLEWIELPSDTVDERYAITDCTVLGCYFAAGTDGSSSWWEARNNPAQPGARSRCGSFDEAKLAAESHYRERMMVAMEVET